MSKDDTIPAEWGAILTPAPPRDVGLHENHILVYGRPKIGKTTFTSRIPNALHLDTEGGGAKHVAGAVLEVIAFTRLDSAWKNYERRLTGGDQPSRPATTFMAQVDNLVKHAGNAPFQVVVIDTIDKLIEMAENHTLEKFGKTDLKSCGGFGKGWQYMRGAVMDAINRLKAAGYSLVFTSHAEERTMAADESANPLAIAAADIESGEVTMMTPTIPDKKIRQLVPAMCNIILYADIQRTGERVVHTQPTAYYDAGDHSGRLPDHVPLNWDAFVEAYYGGKDTALATLTDKITTGEKYLEEHGIDYNKADVSGMSIGQLAARVKYLRQKAKAVTQEKGAA